MNPRQIQSEHYLKALIVVLSLYVGSFVYLELTTVKKEELLSNEGLYEVALEEVTEEDIAKTLAANASIPLRMWRVKPAGAVG